MCESSERQAGILISREMIDAGEAAIEASEDRFETRALASIVYTAMELAKDSAQGIGEYGRDGAGVELLPIEFDIFIRKLRAANHFKFSFHTASYPSQSDAVSPRT